MKTNNVHIIRVANKKTLVKTIAIAVAIVLLVFQPRFSIVYTHIKREEVERYLVKYTTPQIDIDQGLKYCNYNDIILNKSTIIMPSVDFIPPAIDEKLLFSGQYVPTECKPLYKVAVIIPYRNRQSQLEIFLPYIHNFLQRQRIHYRIFLVQQGDNGPWNKGKLFNVGSRVAKDLNFPCLVLHDVDMLPLSPSHLYACTFRPRHMSASVDKFRYHLPYDYLIGGALAILQEQYEMANGFSNKYEMWGGEDDDFYYRLKNEDLVIVRFPPEMSRYTMMVHSQEPINPNRHQLVEDNIGKHHEDGLSTLTYKNITITNYPLYTNITVLL